MLRFLLRVAALSLALMLLSLFFATPVESASQSVSRPTAGELLKDTVQAAADVTEQTWRFLGAIGTASKDAVDLIWQISPSCLGLVNCLVAPLAAFGLKILLTLGDFLRPKK